MTAQRISAALAYAWERMAAWADLLDAINVFPVADGDTGRNLTVSLMPLHQCDIGSAAGAERVVREIQRRAVGNSGNIAACFLAGFLAPDGPLPFYRAAAAGRDAAWASVGEPKAGTMLSVFDALAAAKLPSEADEVSLLIESLADAVRFGPAMLPELEAAGVVDAGALGMFIFLEGFFSACFGRNALLMPVTDRFGPLLDAPRKIPGHQHHAPADRCVQAVIRPRPIRDDGGDNEKAVIRTISHYGDSMVVAKTGEALKVHFHTGNECLVRSSVGPVGEVLEWSAMPMTAEENRAPKSASAVHIMTDAAGSIDPAEARRWGMTVLASYVIVDGRALPETLMEPALLYAAMRSGGRVSTAQASNFERHERYTSALGRFDRVLYLCVGSAYTGNFAAACRWQAAHDPDGRMTVIDTGAASGRLGAIAVSAAQYAAGATSPQTVADYVRYAMEASEEYVFLDRLNYLSRSGRISRPGAFMGDMLHMKPVITPTADGAKRIGMTRNRKSQLAFAMERLERRLKSGRRHLVLLQYSDNITWVEKNVLPAVKRRYGASDIRVQPLSLTSGAHMGPGAWAVAFMPAVTG